MPLQKQLYFTCECGCKFAVCIECDAVKRQHNGKKAIVSKIVDTVNLGNEALSVACKYKHTA